MATTLPLRRAALAAAALASVFLLAACAPSTSAKTDYPGEPRVEHPVEQDEEGTGDTEAEEEEESPEGGEGSPTAVWLQQGGVLAVTVWGSSTCPPVGTNIEVVDPAGEGNTVAITLKDYGNAVCTMDLVPHTTEFWAPMDVTTTEPLTVRVAGSEVEVPVK
ncbi:hypothetical protein ACDF64_01800 [Agromyces sp. MMS24-JH15]|uniref:hypothetical protein n=1 Tax=Agromyces sp. MMS24-JH15 TaxID=3243765 RepID=UPI003747BCCB